MAEINGRFVAKGGKLLQGMPHVLRRPLEQPAAAERKQRVGGKQQLVLGEMVADMPGRVPRGLDDLHRMIAEQEFVAVADYPGAPGHSNGLVDRPGYPQHVSPLERKLGFKWDGVVGGGEA